MSAAFQAALGPCSLGQATELKPAALLSHSWVKSHMWACATWLGGGP